MDSFFKKRSLSPQPNGSVAKRARATNDDLNGEDRSPYPKVVVAWNCNGLTSRLRNPTDAKQIKEFVTKYKPDVIFLSEVRVSAASNNSDGKPGPHTKFFRSRMRDNDKKALEDVVLVRSFLSSEEFSKYKLYLSLANTKYAGTAMLLNTRTTGMPISVRYNLDKMNVKGSIHDSDGRVIVAKFEGFSILHTYSPNNGWEESSFVRRREWDEKIRSFMQRKKEAGVRIMWVGDLNVAPHDEDLSHASYARRQKGGRSASRKGKIGEPVMPENVGQPGCTDAERNRFEKIFEDGDLVDAYRELVGTEDKSGMTWRGIPSGKFGGKGMRIDHCIVSKSFCSRVESVEISGHGVDRIGFLGSDHCPLVVRVGEQGAETTENASAKKDMA